MTELDPTADFLAREQEDLAELVTGDNTTLAVDDVASDLAECRLEDEASEFNGSLDGHDGDQFSQMNGTSKSEPKEEPEQIRIWREAQQVLLEKKDAEEVKRKEELRKDAADELQTWRVRYAEQLEKAKASNREASKSAEKEWIAERDAEQPGQEWERIANMCDFNPKTARNSKDTSRMKSIILQLKQSPVGGSIKANGGV